jgi:nicotinamidase-related amidase
MTQALILIDLQNDYFPDGSMELEGMEGAADNARRLLDRFRSTQGKLFHVQHFSVRPGSTFFVPDTKGVEINDKVVPAPGETVIEKNYPNSFRDTALLETLRENGVDSLLICGAMSHMCIDATTRAAADLGFTCTVIHDACATKSLEFAGLTIPAPEVHGAFMAALGAAYAQVLSTADFLSGFAQAD